MLQKEIRVLVERGLHTQGFLRYGNLDPQLLNLYLNKSINEYLDSMLVGLREGDFEDSTILITDLEKLKGIVTLSKESTSAFSDSESYVIAAKSGDIYREWLKFKVQVTSKYLKTPTYKKIRIVDEEYVDDLLDDTYHKTSYESPLATIIDGRVRVYKNSDFTVGDGELIYLKEPVKFNVIVDADVEYNLPSRIVNAVIERTVQAMRQDDNIIATKERGS